MNAATNMELCKVYNMPLLDMKWYPSYLTRGKENAKHIVAQYVLESSVIAVDRERTKYIMLNHDEAVACTKPLSWYCDFKNPIYPININKYCVVAILMENKEAIKELCKISVKPNEVLPRAAYVSGGVWIVSTIEQFKFTIVCEKVYPVNKISKVSPPLDVVRLNMGCVANNPFITLPPIHDLKSTNYI